MNEAMKLAWLEISQMLGEPTREELDVFLRTWQRATEAHKQALAEQPAQQEPVAHFGSAYVNENGVHITTVLGPVAIPQDAKLYTSPPAQRTWAGLTDEEVKECFDSVATQDCQNYEHWRLLCARNIEAKLKEKNT